MAFPAIQAAYPQSYPQDLWIDKKELKKRGLSALVDISHEVGWRLGLHQ
ncbi:hypothetical protein [Herminiimonas contaminans]|uniref:Uncharacterized protein n=1 Tax=Herminiimonas contaminans TaxID=1111140 RepID=A0ABS0EUX6_9BURK|nr:hypothetical protein [Herminiimonas contaminans]MBF8177884.1 hypothetical protein [Herminiimonas contaminans]